LALSGADLSHLAAAKIRSEIPRRSRVLRVAGNVSHARGNPGRGGTRERERGDSFSAARVRESFDSPRSHSADISGSWTDGNDVSRSRGGDERKSAWARTETFEIIGDRGNFADFKRVSSGLSNGTRMRITRPAAAFITADDFTVGGRDPKVSRSGEFHGVIRMGRRKGEWRRKKRDDGAQNAKRRGYRNEGEGTGKSGNSMQ